MPVIINDFEIVPEPAEATAPATTQPSPETEKKPAAPEIDRILSHIKERQLRLWAH